MTPEQEQMTIGEFQVDRLKKLAAGDEQLSIALGLDYQELLQRVALQRMLNADTEPFPLVPRQVEMNAWLQRLDLILPELAERVECLYPCLDQGDEGEAFVYSLCVVTGHNCGSDDEYEQAEAECKTLAERLAELVAAVPGPIETVAVIPSCLDLNLAEVTLPGCRSCSGQANEP